MTNVHSGRALQYRQSAEDDNIFQRKHNRKHPERSIESEKADFITHVFIKDPALLHSSRYEATLAVRGLLFLTT